jgi:hypothetical protein
MRLRLLRVAAHVEVVTVVVLFANLATVHWRAISSSIGPTHGCAYLFVVLAVLGDPAAARPAKLLAFVPGAGGLLALRLLARADRGARPASAATRP